MKANRKQTLYFAILLSLGLHLGLLLNSSSMFVSFKKVAPHQFKVVNLRTVGEQKGVKDKLLYLKTKSGNQSKPTKLKDLAFRPSPPPSAKPQTKKDAKLKKILKKLPKTLNAKNKDIKNFLKTPINHSIGSTMAMKTLANTGVGIKFDIPKGVKEDKLNKDELVFYSFQKRAAIAYVNSFYNKLNEFERRNPHLKFPMTEDEKQLAGKIVYDANGDILQIKTLQWTELPTLNRFFEDVLKELHKLPNPPEQIIKDGQFAVNFILTLNKTYQ